MEDQSDLVRPDPIEAWIRTRLHLDRLFDALADLDEAGGIGEVALIADWTVRDSDRAASRVRLVRDMLNTELHRLQEIRNSWG